MVKFESKEDSNILDMLMNYYHTKSKTKIRNLIRFGSIALNDNPVKRTDEPVSKGDVIVISDIRTKTPEHRGSPYKIIFEDQFLIAVFKPAGLVTCGDVPDRQSTLHKNLNHYLNSDSKTKIQLYIIHRIDKEVEGIVLFAKSEEVQLQIKDNWTDVEKKYYALVNGKPPENEGIVSSWLREGSKQKVYSVRESENSKYSITRYRLVKKIENFSLLEVKIETGRKNQIRVHMSDLGCPIVGDWKYGDTSKIKRQVRLIAFSLSFTHPVTKKRVKLEIPLPSRFLRPGITDEKYK